METEVETTTATVNPLDNAVCFVLKISALGNSRKVNTSAVEADCDKAMLAVNKHLFDSKEYKAIKQKHGEIRQFVYSRSVPAFFIRDGVYMIRADKATGIMEVVDRLIAECDALADDFAAAYPALVRDAETRLRSLYNPADYLPADSARAKFSVSYQFVEFGAPGRLRTIAPEFFNEESRKLRETFANAADSITQLLYTETSDLLTHAIERLSGNGDGKPKIFRDSLVANLKEFFATLKDRNLTDEAELNRVADSCSAILSNVSPDKLRDSDTLRTEIVRGFQAVKTAVDAAMIDKPTRMIELD